jgi:DnaJ-class molecular chaperone
MDYYQLLGVQRTASATEIKQAYRQLAVRYHPDKNDDPGVENLFKQITQAYNILSDPERKRLYDTPRVRLLRLRTRRLRVR